MRRPPACPTRVPRAAWPAVAAALLLVAPVLPSGAVAQTVEDCLICHEDPDLTGERDGREISVFVDPAAFSASIHRDLDCVTCHLDLEGQDVHDDVVEPVDCSWCHDDVVQEVASSRHGRLNPGSSRAPSCADCHTAHAIQPVDGWQQDCSSCHARTTRDQLRSLHGQAFARGDELAPTCSTCHGSHEILPRSDPNSPVAVTNVPMLCGKCHQEGAPVALNRELPQDHILENYSMSIHGEGLFRQGLTVTAVCSSCHTAHLILPHDDPASSIHRDNIALTCEQCHGQIEQVHRQVIQGHLWREAPEKIPVCVDCHSPHKIRNVLYPAGSANRDCLSCHADPELSVERGGETVSLFVDEVAFLGSEHKNTACAQCHSEVTPSLARPCATVVSPVDCSVCHAEVVAQYQVSTHGTLAASGDPDAPVCLDCHDDHATQGKEMPSSPTFARNVPRLCGGCHRVGEQAAVRIESEVPDIYSAYLDSIHGKGLVESGLLVTATCADCHGAHSELPPSDPASRVHPDNVADTCGSCHHGIEETFQTSIHWRGSSETDRDLPTCEDCHSSHTIQRTDQGGFRFQMMDQCGRCHEAEAETFFDTFHGKVSRLGSQGAAKCSDCHGTHDILPPSDPLSRLSRDNVVDTCGQCHESSHRRFAGYLTHATHHDPERYPWLFWTFWGMTALLVGTLTFALLHTLAWLVRLYLSRDEWRRHKALAHAEPGQKLYRRFDRYNRTLHLVMMISFFTLALTGMALKFSYMSWAQGLSTALGGFAAMGYLHRIGAVTLVIVFGIHLARVFRRKKREGLTWGRILQGPDTILFTPRDLKEVVQSIRWFFGIGPRPRYGRYTYWEKFDYFAVLWGVVIIGTTGLILWFPTLFTRVLPGWSVNVATIIHSDEALLAVGFIFTIHFFNTHFRPDKFPMDPVIFTGRVPLAELRYDKPDEYARMVESGELEEHMVDAIPSPVERGLRVFGFLVLTVGLTLIVLIVYTMLFGYR